MSLERLTPYHRAKRWFLLTWLTLGLVGLMGCTSTQAHLTVTIPESLKTCPRTDRPSIEGLTVGKLAAYSVQQAADLEVCDSRREAAISIIETINKANAPKRQWWRLGN